MFVPVWLVGVLVALAWANCFLLMLLDARRIAARRAAREWERDARYWHRYATGTRAPEAVSVEVLPQFNPPVVVFSVRPVPNEA